VAATVAQVDRWEAKDAADDVRRAYDQFPYWDVLLYPIRKASETAELDRVQVMRLSPYETDMLWQPKTRKQGPLKLEGIKAGHFGAFFSREARENDYLWGRLDAAEWIIRSLLNGADHRALRAFEAILGEEAGRLGKVADLREDLERQVRSGSGTPG
jgi:hypothetical protein